MNKKLIAVSLAISLVLIATSARGIMAQNLTTNASNAVGNMSSSVNQTGAEIGNNMSNAAGNASQTVNATMSEAGKNASASLNKTGESANATLNQLGKNASEVGSAVLNKTVEVGKKIVGGAADVVSNISGEI